MYCGEIPETSIKGALGSFLQLFNTIGILYSYAIGPFVSYAILWILCAILPVIFFVCFMMMPEFPYFLLSKGRREEAIVSLAKLRSKSEAAIRRRRPTKCSLSASVSCYCICIISLSLPEVLSHRR